MNQPTLQAKLLSPAGFGLVLLLFFLPFIAVSCGPADQRVTASFSGLSMVAGTAPSYSGDGITADNQADLQALFEDQYDNEPLAVLAAIVILGGMVTAFVRDRRVRNTAALVCSGVAAALLVAAEIRAINRLNHVELTGDAADVTDVGPIIVSPRIGFYLAIAVLLVLIVAHAVAMLRKAPPGPPPPEEPAYETEPYIVESFEPPDEPTVRDGA